MSATMNPDCRDGKHRACAGDGWDEAAEAAAPCPCDCHQETQSKPLVLVIPTRIEPSCKCGCRPHDYERPDGSRVSWFDAKDEADQKRFTNAELTAEYWRASERFARLNYNQLSSGEDFPEGVWDTAADQLNTLHRFAARPHYDEAQL